MRWPWGRRPVDGGKRALEHAIELRRQAEERAPEVERVARELARHRRRNNFGAAIEAIFRGQP